MTITQALIQGIIQGLTEFLPVSSSGHLSVFQYFTGLSGESAAFFTVALHFGTLLAVFIAFWRTILDLIIEAFLMLGDLVTLRFRWKDMNPNRRMILLLLVSLLPLVAVVFLKDFYESFSTDSNVVVEGLCLMFTGVLLWLAEHTVRGHREASNMTYGSALCIGAVQAIAPMPGISRSGSTIAAGVMLGLDKSFAVTFSFIMGIPAVMGAVLLEIPGLLETGLTLPLHIVLIGVVTSAVFGILAIRLVKLLVVSNKFIWFSYYTLAAGALVTAAGVYDLFSGHQLQAMISSLF